MANKTNTKINNKDYYRITLDLGRNAEGKRVRKQFYGKSKKEAEEKKLEYLRNSALGIVDNTLYLGKAMNDWLYEIKKLEVKASSFERYEGIFRNYLKDSLISIMALDKIKPIDIQRYYNELFKSGKSSNSIKNVHKLLKQFFAYCEDNDYIVKTPISGKKVMIPKDTNNTNIKKEVEVFTNEEMKSILSIEENTIIKYAALISYATGMRKGEILGLKESDINYKTREINIQRSIVTSTIIDEHGNRNKQTYVSDTKTSNSIRTIPLPNELISIIKKVIILKKEMVLKYGVNLSDDFKDMLFISKEGNFINSSNFDKSWISFLKRCGIKHKKFHALRHTYATRQFESGTQVLTVSKLLGHSNIDITLDIYTHVLKKEKEKAIDTLSLLSV
ncbi:site-specific integrase [uncultured Clostridium sp.]|uniref:tyrosine-type recombinase/integrase n=1 Tax=uncultured Clostridium sp. TaxID=59620 RepID=UPI0025E60609|nr:site-specific integrase [uncultured Clostridium sp.]